LTQETPTGPPEPARHSLKVTRVGVVDSISGLKTVRVVVRSMVKDRLYGKYLRRRTRLLVHSPSGEAQVGDTVEIARCRPISKHKAWRLVRVVRRARAV